MPLAHAGPMDHISLCETLDRVLSKGAVIAGEVIISVANVDLLYLGLQLVLTSMESRPREDPGLDGAKGIF